MFYFQCKNIDQKREWTSQLKRVILENYSANIPPHARQLVMELGQAKSSGKYVFIFIYLFLSIYFYLFIYIYLFISIYLYLFIYLFIFILFLFIYLFFIYLNLFIYY